MPPLTVRLYTVAYKVSSASFRLFMQSAHHFHQQHTGPYVLHLQSCLPSRGLPLS